MIHEDGSVVEKGSVELYRRDAKKPAELIVQQAREFPLAKLGLVKGDKLTVTLRAVDYRGKHEGKTATAEPLVFQVTDDQGILERVTEFDPKTEEQLQTMIQRQLGIGGEVP